MMPSARILCAALSVLAASLLAAAPARAALNVCNQTSYIIYAAIGYQERNDAVTRGWTRIVPGDCTDVFSAPLTAPAYYLYAKSSQAHSGPARAWGGKIRLCAKDTNFALHQPLIMESCPDDSFVMPFSRVDTKGEASWSTTLTESPRISSLELARQAGIARLLIDSGYKLRDSGSAEAALKSFRLRMKMSAHASNADLFDALEAEALKAAAPAGYSVCNDSDGPIYAAIGMHDAKNWDARGWWKVSPGGCARVLTKPLSNDRIFLLAQGPKNPNLVSGPTRFCIANIEFETSQHDNCAAHGLTAAGFAATIVKGVEGYAAHIGDSGLLPQAVHMPK
jgi:uncharacterized membrane protein